jgi:hypothetical protein
MAGQDLTDEEARAEGLLDEASQPPEPPPNAAPPLKTDVSAREPDAQQLQALGLKAPVSRGQQELTDEEARAEGLLDEPPAQAAPVPLGPLRGVSDADFTPQSEGAFAGQEEARLPASVAALEHSVELKTPLDEATQNRRKASYLSWLGAHQNASPEQRAETLELASVYDLPPDLAESQREQLVRTTTRQKLLEGMVRAPALIPFLKDGAKAPLVKDDLDAISRMSAGLTEHFEWLGGLQDAFGAGVDEIEYAGRSLRQAVGASNEHNDLKLREFEGGRNLRGDFGASTRTQKMALGAVQALPTIGAYAASGGPVGAGVIALLQNVGPLFRNLKQLKGEDGSPLLDDAQARKYALSGSSIAALIMAIPGSKIAGRALNALPIVNRLTAELGTDILSKALQQPTVLRTLAVAPLKLGVRAGEGGLLMASQAAANAGALELAKSNNGQEADLGNVSHAAKEAFVDGVLTFAPFTLLGGGHEFFHDLGLAKALQDNTMALDLAVGAAKESKLRERSPEQFEKLVQLNQSPKPSVFFDRADWDEHWAKKGEDPAAKAAQVMGDDGTAYAEALNTGGDLVIPKERYLSRLAEEHEAGLREIARSEADQPSIRQMTREADRLEAVAKEAAAGVEAPKDDAHLVAKDIADKAIAAGQDEGVARATGALWGAWARRMGDALGTTPSGAYEQLVKVRINPVAETEVAPAKAAQLSQPLPAEHPAIAGVRQAFEALGPEEQVRAFYEEPVTGLLNERAFQALPKEGPSARGVNLGGGHQVPQRQGGTRARRPAAQGSRPGAARGGSRRGQGWR